jgi:hypothetical protein
LNAAGIAHNLLDVFSRNSRPYNEFSASSLKEMSSTGTKIEIEPEKAQQTSGDVAVTPDQIDIVLFAQLLRVRRFVSDAPQSRDASAFLIDCDDRLDVAQVAQIVDKLSELRRALEIASEQNVCPGCTRRNKRAVSASSSFPGTPVIIN